MRALPPQRDNESARGWRAALDRRGRDTAGDRRELPFAQRSGRRRLTGTRVYRNRAARGQLCVLRSDPELAGGWNLPERDGCLCFRHSDRPAFRRAARVRGDHRRAWIRRGDQTLAAPLNLPDCRPVPRAARDPRRTSGDPPRVRLRLFIVRRGRLEHALRPSGPRAVGRRRRLRPRRCCGRAHEDRRETCTNDRATSKKSEVHPLPLLLDGERLRHGFGCVLCRLAE